MSREPDKSSAIVPAWRRCLLGSAFLAVGVGSLIWSIADLAGWIAALRGGSAVVATESGLFGGPFLALCIGMISVMVFVSPAAKIGRRRFDEMAFAAVLATGAVAIALLVLGGPAVDAVMRRHDYRACSSHSGIRVTFKTWARAGRLCPASAEYER